MKAIVPRLLYTFFVVLSLLLCFMFIRENLEVLIDMASEHPDLFSQMYTLTQMQAAWYSAVYAVAFISAFIFCAYFFIKANKKNALIVATLIWLLAVAELYTDSLFHIMNV